MTTAVARQTTAVARPLKTLVPLIGAELQAGDEAGIEHYRRAGDLLLEAREQVAHFKWGAWLSANFELSKKTAWRYMRLAEKMRDGHRVGADTTVEAVIGEQPRRARHDVWKPLQAATVRVDADKLGQERQTQHAEITLHRELALELVDIGYRAMATRLHPDKGGSKDAMRRLNRVRDELKALAETRRFI